MTCDLVQRRLLSLSEPARVPDELLGHLAACPGCARVVKKLAEVERLAAQLPVPAPPLALKEVVIRRVLTDPTLRASVRGRAPVVERRWPRYAVAAAVSLAFFGTLTAVWRAKEPQAAKQSPANDPILASVMRSSLALAAAGRPEQRVGALALLADDLSADTRTLGKVADAADLALLVKCYRRVVNEGLIPQALALTADERPHVLTPVADRLGRAATDADKLAGEVPPAAAAALKALADSARAAHRQLQLIMQGRAA